MSFIRKDVSIRDQIETKKVKNKDYVSLGITSLPDYDYRFFQCNMAVTNYCSQNLDIDLEYLLIYSLTKN